MLSSEKHHAHYTSYNTEISNGSQHVFILPIIDIIGNFLSYKAMLTKLESLLDKALRGIGLVELPIIMVMVDRLSVLLVQLLAAYRVRRGGLCEP